MTFAARGSVCSRFGQALSIPVIEGGHGGVLGIELMSVGLSLGGIEPGKVMYKSMVCR